MRTLIDIPPIIEHPITLGVLFILTSYCFYHLLLNIKRRRLIEDIPRSKIRSAPQGYVELHGKAKSFELTGLKTPIGGHQCLWYEYLVYDFSGNKGSMKIYDQESDSRDFLISDETGDCMVDLQGAKVYGRSETWKIDKSKLPGYIQDKISYFRDEVHVTERTIEEGDPIVAAGLFQTNGTIGKPMNLTGDSRELMMAWFSDKKSMLKRWDTNHNGQLDSNELKKLHRHTWNKILSNLHKNKDDYTIHILGQTGNKSQTFVVSVGDEMDLKEKVNKQLIIIIIMTLWMGSGFFFLAAIKLLNYFYNLGYF